MWRAEMTQVMNVRGEMRADGWNVWVIMLTVDELVFFFAFLHFFPLRQI